MLITSHIYFKCSHVLGTVRSWPCMFQNHLSFQAPPPPSCHHLLSVLLAFQEYPIMCFFLSPTIFSVSPSSACTFWLKQLQLLKTSCFFSPLLQNTATKINLNTIPTHCHIFYWPFCREYFTCSILTVSLTLRYLFVDLPKIMTVQCQ